jgi:hypothetical protein
MSLTSAQTGWKYMIAPTPARVLQVCEEEPSETPGTAVVPATFEWLYISRLYHCEPALSRGINSSASGASRYWARDERCGP